MTGIPRITLGDRVIYTGTRGPTPISSEGIDRVLAAAGLPVILRDRAGWGAALAASMTRWWLTRLPWVEAKKMEAAVAAARRLVVALRPVLAADPYLAGPAGEMLAQAEYFVDWAAGGPLRRWQEGKGIGAQPGKQRRRGGAPKKPPIDQVLADLLGLWAAAYGPPPAECTGAVHSFVRAVFAAMAVPALGERSTRSAYAAARARAEASGWRIIPPLPAGR